MVERRLDRGVSDGWAWRRWNGEVVEDTAPEPYGDAWHYLVGKVVIAAARLELALAFFAAARLTGDVATYRSYLRGQLRDRAREAAKLATTPPGAREAVRAALDALGRRDNIVHWPPVIVVTPDGAPPDQRRSASGHWRLPTKDVNALPEDVATVAELREILGELERAQGPVARAGHDSEPTAGSP